MMKERRDYRRRAETMRAIVECLTRHNDGITMRQLLAIHDTLSRSATERVVRRLAILGLVRQPCAGTWIAAPPLRHPAQLVAGTGIG
jgi:hypothetical protein